jgi:DNA topoisomerase I
VASNRGGSTGFDAVCQRQHGWASPPRIVHLTGSSRTQQAERNVLAAVDDVAHRLGNTREIARASYISPRVIDHYMEGSVIAYYGELVEEIVAVQKGLTEGEEALLKLLNKKLRRELERAA